MAVALCRATCCPQLTDVIVEMASNIMLVDDHILWMSQKEEKACTSIVRSLERIAAHTLGSNSQHMAVVRGNTGWGWVRGGWRGRSGWAAGVGSLPMPGGSLPVPGLMTTPRRCAWQNSRNIAFEAYVVKPESYVGLSCVAFQRRDGAPPGRSPTAERGAEPMPDQQLRLRCTTGRPNVSLTSFHIKVRECRGVGGLGVGPCSPVTVHPQNSIALASIQLPPSLFASPVPATQGADCKLQLLVFRNGKLFCSTGNSSRLADDGKRRSVATPVIYAGTCKGSMGGALWAPWALCWCPRSAEPSPGSSWGDGNVPVGCAGSPVSSPSGGAGGGVSPVLLTRFLCGCRWLWSGEPVRAGGCVPATPWGGHRPRGCVLELRGAGGHGGLERRGVPAGRPRAQCHLPALPAPQQRGRAHGRCGASSRVGVLPRWGV